VSIIDAAKTKVQLGGVTQPSKDLSQKYTKDGGRRLGVVGK
jgi:hypothetical protein